jgi:hypothetical protein
MAATQIIVLGVYHSLQSIGHPSNHRLRQSIEMVRQRFPIEIILEKWTDTEPSFIATIDPKLPCKNIGTPNEPQYATNVYGINWEPNDPFGHDSSKPILLEYGPPSKQELREKFMVDRTVEEMQPYSSGLLVLGLAHLSSIMDRLRKVDFAPLGFSLLCE